MGIDATVTKTASVLGKRYQVDESLSSDAASTFEVTLVAAKTGSLTTRTDNTTGTLTMAGGHGIATGNRLDLYWDGGSRRGIVVGTVATNSVPFSGGNGDNLPSATTAITAQVPVTENITVDGDDAVGLLLSNDSVKAATFVLAESDDSEVYGKAVAASSAYSWFSSGGGTNPLAGGAVTKVFLSHGDSAASRKVRGVVMYN